MLQQSGLAMAARIAPIPSPTTDASRTPRHDLRRSGLATHTTTSGSPFGPPAPRHGHGMDASSSSRGSHRGLELRLPESFKRLQVCSGIKPPTTDAVSPDDVGAHMLDAERGGWCAADTMDHVNWLSLFKKLPTGVRSNKEGARTMRHLSKCNCASRGNVDEDKEGTELGADADEETPSAGVGIAIAVLKFYKREISPLIPGSCRYVPTCSEYGMQAFKTYGVVKGFILTAWRLSRCNPLGGSGFDPPRWFDEAKPPSY